MVLDRLEIGNKKVSMDRGTSEYSLLLKELRVLERALRSTNPRIVSSQEEKARRETEVAQDKKTSM